MWWESYPQLVTCCKSCYCLRHVCVCVSSNQKAVLEIRLLMWATVEMVAIIIIIIKTNLYSVLGPKIQRRLKIQRRCVWLCLFFFRRVSKILLDDDVAAAVARVTLPPIVSCFCVDLTGSKSERQPTRRHIWQWSSPAYFQFFATATR